MKRILRTVSIVVALAAGLVWLAAGAHTGWTQTSVAVKSVDDITGLEAITYRKRFVPGVDFLGGALLGAGMLAGASVMFRNKSQKNQTD